MSDPNRNKMQPESVFRWNGQRHRAALLLAENELSDREIASELGINRVTLHRWKLEPEFAAQVGDHVGEIKARMLRRAIAKKERRIDVLNDLHDKLLTVIAERADNMADAAPGGGTGLLVRQEKQIGTGDRAVIIEEYQVDTGTIRELRALHEQAAKELGQWVEKSQIEDLTRVVEIVGIESDAI